MSRHVYIHRGKTRDAESLFSAGQLASLRAEYAKIDHVDPSQPSYGKLTTFLNGLSQPRLKQLATAEIKFVSKLAKNRVTRDASLGRLLDTQTNGRFTVKVFYNAENAEYVCRLFKDGVAYEPADYFTDDKQDAMDSAKRMLREAK